MDLNAFLEAVWDGILCMQSARVMQTYLSLNEDDQHTVKNHLLRMTTESGWHPEQVKSAKFALSTIVSLEEK